MSIVERAMQKAQQKAQAQPAPAAPAVVPNEIPAAEVTQPVAVEAGLSFDPERREPERPSGVDLLSLTARDLKPLVEIQVEKLRAEGRLPLEHMSRQIDEEMRRIKWPLLAAIAGRGGVTPARNNIIQVTSALPAEGKTFTSLNLAMSIAKDREMRVILVDGDVARPGLTPTLGLSDHRGLNDALDNDSLEVATAVLPTDVRGLHLLPIGRRAESATELLASARMRQVVDELGRLDDNAIVLLDSPPMLLTSEAQVLASLFGQVVLVVAAGRTPQQAVVDALGIIGEGPRVGLVLNQALHDNNVGGYYGYGYGDGFLESTQTEKK